MATEMGLEDQVKPGMSFAAICRLLEGWMCTRARPHGAPGGTDTWDFTNPFNGQTIRGTFHGGKLLVHGEPTSDPAPP